MNEEASNNLNCCSMTRMKRMLIKLNLTAKNFLKTVIAVEMREKMSSNKIERKSRCTTNIKKKQLHGNKGHQLMRVLCFFAGKGGTMKVFSHIKCVLCRISKSLKRVCWSFKIWWLLRGVYHNSVKARFDSLSKHNIINFF